MMVDDKVEVGVRGEERGWYPVKRDDEKDKSSTSTDTSSTSKTTTSTQAVTATAYISAKTTLATVTSTQGKENVQPTAIAANASAASASSGDRGIQDSHPGLPGTSIAMIVLATAGGTMLLMLLIFLLLKRNQKKPPSSSLANGKPTSTGPRQNQHKYMSSRGDVFPSNPVMQPDRRWSYQTDDTDVRNERLGRVRSDLLAPRDLGVRDDLAVTSHPRVGDRESWEERGVRSQYGDVNRVLGLGDEGAGVVREVPGGEGRVVIEAGGTWEEGRVLAQRDSGAVSEVSEGNGVGRLFARPVDWLRGRRREQVLRGGSDRSSMSTVWR